MSAIIEDFEFAENLAVNYADTDSLDNYIDDFPYSEHVHDIYDMPEMATQFFAYDYIPYEPFKALANYNYELRLNLTSLKF